MSATKPTAGDYRSLAYFLREKGDMHRMCSFEEVLNRLKEHDPQTALLIADYERLERRFAISQLDLIRSLVDKADGLPDTE